MAELIAYSALSDGELLDYLARGSQRALREIYARYWDKVLSVAANRIEDADAQEAVQNVFINLWRRRETVGLKEKLITYLSVAVKYEILKKLRDQGRSYSARSLIKSESSLLSKYAFIASEAAVPPRSG